MPSTTERAKQCKNVSNDGNATDNIHRKRGWEEIESIFELKKDQKQSVAATKQSKDRNNGQQYRQKVTPSSSRRSTYVTHNNVSKFNDSNDAWVDDGLGGKYNSEGFTGRIEDGVKIFKAHILSKPNSGNTPNCPFDCDCCYI